ncbi:hypothetical protein [Natrinema salifodinae]|uniref:Uncharacterized protein n=1 Tax=Natrinema salifodinae TaxID=1202768 RepID=A0A1I0P7B4_9EURY|nr:hypothetical protein [Natrinema salifodinae]SEW10246.1 hypothetical protein SAMN05216285_2240 [Natrinema salifodinae]
MGDLQLYTLVVPQDSQSGLSAQLQQQLATAGILGQDGGIVEQLSSEPGDQTITGLYRARYAGKMADELEELAQASGFDEIPLAGLDEATSKDGYYAIQDADVEQVQPHTTEVQRFDLSLTKKGTRNDHWRALETNRRQLDHEFGNSTSPVRVGVPAIASKVQWYNPEDQARAPASSIETRSAELGDVEIYDVDDGEAAVGTSTPTLLYEIAYTDEELADCRVYDTLGHGSKLDANGDLQWQKLFSTQHDFDAPIVMDNGRIRLRLDEPNGTLEAEEWDATNEVWSTVGLEADQPSTVELFDVDLTGVAMVRDQAQLTFDVDGELFALDAIVNRGYDDVQFTIPENENGPIDPDLEDWLSPIASTLVVDPNASKGLVARNEVRR